jgi:hypothetical protein
MGFSLWCRPNYDGNDWKGFIGSIGQNHVIAIKASGVKHVSLTIACAVGITSM